MIGSAAAAPHVKIRLAVNMVPNLETATVWGTFPGTSDENIVHRGPSRWMVRRRQRQRDGRSHNAGVGRIFRQNPQGTAPPVHLFSRHQRPSRRCGPQRRWLTDHKEFFAKTALLINCEHTAAEQLVLANGTIRKTNTTTPLTWYVGGSPGSERS